MPRTVKPWIGKSDDSMPPSKVRDRLFDRHDGKCHLCQQPIVQADGYELDHIIALINGGPNTEANLAPVHKQCHRLKTARDVAEKAKVSRTRQKHRRIVKETRPIQSAGFAISEKAAKRLPKEPLAPKRLYQPNEERT